MGNPRDVACPHCHAQPGQECHADRRAVVAPHTARVELHKQHLAELKKLEDWNRAWAPPRRQA